MKNSKGIRGIIFDLDGTLIDSFEAIREGFNAVLPRYSLAPFSLEETKALVGKPLLDTFAELIGEAEAKEATRVFRERYREVFLEKTRPLPYADGVIATLAGRGYSMGIATNKQGGFSRQIVAHLGWSGAIPTVVGDGDVPRCKPDPDMLHKNLEAMGYAPGEALYVGDSPIDMATGKNAGVRTIGVATGHHSMAALEEAGASRVITNLSELEETLS